jgi:hypothetical protein
MSVRDVAGAVKESDLAKVAQNLKRATDAGILERERMKFNWRTCWGYRKAEKTPFVAPALPLRS